MSNEIEKIILDFEKSFPNGGHLLTPKARILAFACYKKGKDDQKSYLISDLKEWADYKMFIDPKCDEDHYFNGALEDLKEYLESLGNNP